MKNKYAWLILSGGFLFGALTGCTSEAKQDYGAAGDHAVSAAKEAGKAISSDATAVGHSIKAAIHNVEGENKNVSSRVKEAILDSPDIHTSDLSVDTSGMKVTLHGRVKTEVQNQKAAHIVRATLGTAYTVNDELKIGGGE